MKSRVFPKRSETHIIESASWKLLDGQSPARWILREVTERDYGIDCYIELGDDNGDITGKLLSGQLKGTGELVWNSGGKQGDRTVMFSGIDIATVNYWMGLPVPVFLFVADLNAGKVFFAPVKEQIRERYDDYENATKTFGFRLSEQLEVGNETGRRALDTYYFLERSFVSYENGVLALLSHWQAYLRFIDSVNGRDMHMTLEDDEAMLFYHLYSTCTSISGLLGIVSGMKTIEQIFRDDSEAFKTPYGELHYHSTNDVLPSVRSWLITLLSSIKRRVVETEEAYWRTLHPIIYRSCYNLDAEQYRTQIVDW